MEVLDPRTLSMNECGLLHRTWACRGRLRYVSVNTRSQTRPERPDSEASLESRWGERLSFKGFSALTGKDDGLLDMTFTGAYPQGVAGDVSGQPIACLIRLGIISGVFSLFSHDHLRVDRETIRSPCSVSCPILRLRSVDLVENVVGRLLHG